uniref:Uncharacterized protein n=1 Tax=Anguilla anguilla TaxID=7936 RepID=A0A0E9UTZ5_ANGAN
MTWHTHFYISFMLNVCWLCEKFSHRHQWQRVQLMSAELKELREQMGPHQVSQSFLQNPILNSIIYPGT